MKKLVLLITLTGALAASAGALVATAPADTSTEKLVVITATGVTPAEVTIRPGDTVTWKNNDLEKHQVISEWGLFKSPLLRPGEKFSYVFEVESSYSYHVAPISRIAPTVVSPRATGAVHVLTTRPTVAITPRSVVYGSPIRVFGSIPSGASDEVVTIHITPYGGTTTNRLLTTTDGTYEFTYRPKVRTEFYATWNDEKSLRAPAIGVRPRVVFRPLNLARNLFAVRVKAARSYARHVVRVQHRNSHGVWVTTRILRLNRHSQVRFTGRFAHGLTRAWAWVAKTPAYDRGFSKIRTVRR